MVIFTKYAVLLKCICYGGQLHFPLNNYHDIYLHPDYFSLLTGIRRTCSVILLQFAPLPRLECASLDIEQGVTNGKTSAICTFADSVCNEQSTFSVQISESTSPQSREYIRPLHREDQQDTEKDHAQFLMYFCCLLQNHTGKCFINGHKFENSCCMFES